VKCTFFIAVLAILYANAVITIAITISGAEKEKLVGLNNDIFLRYANHDAYEYPSSEQQ
jgi:hypothetical protein